MCKQRIQTFTLTWEYVFFVWVHKTRDKAQQTGNSEHNFPAKEERARASATNFY
jgi:hypothetical protein